MQKKIIGIVHLLTLVRVTREKLQVHVFARRGAKKRIRHIEPNFYIKKMYHNTKKKEKTVDVY